MTPVRSQNFFWPIEKLIKIAQKYIKKHKKWKFKGLKTKKSEILKQQISDFAQRETLLGKKQSCKRPIFAHFDHEIALFR